MEWLLNNGSSQEELQTLYNTQYESLQLSMNNDNNNCNNNNGIQFGLVMCPQLLYLLKTNKFINVILTNSNGNLMYYHMKIFVK